MTLAFSTAAIVLAMTLGGAAINPAAAAAGYAPWCVSAPWQGGELNCAYRSLTHCKDMAAPTAGGCILNPQWRRAERVGSK